MEPKLGPPIRATHYVESILVTAILDGTYPAGAPLPGERAMAGQIGVTRPTLRETLQRLASEGWVTIHHGKPTVVNDYWLEGGLRMIGTLAKYAKYLPNGFITKLLEVRVTLLPPVARLAALYQPQKLIDYLSHHPNPANSETTFAEYDWELQMQITRLSGNPVYALIFNDFASVFKKMAILYFRSEISRNASLQYYSYLSDAVAQNTDTVEEVVRFAMQKSIEIWHEVRGSDTKMPL